MAAEPSTVDVFSQSSTEGLEVDFKSGCNCRQVFVQIPNYFLRTNLS